MATIHYGIPGWATFLCVWALVFWLALMEGGKTCHPVAHCSAWLTNAGEPFPYLRGGLRRAFLQRGRHPAQSCGASRRSSRRRSWRGGIAAILLTVMVGQLVAQVNFKKCMLDFVNNWTMVLSARISLCV